MDDELFASAAAAGGLAEVALSQIGLQRTTDADLKKFSQRMIDEHSKANQELMTLAARKRLTLPRTLETKDRFSGEALSGLSGAEFDRCYAKAQFIQHMNAVAAFTAEAERGQDPEIKAWAARTLPHIKEHLATIKPFAEKAEKEKPSTEGAAHHAEEKAASR